MCGESENKQLQAELPHNPDFSGSCECMVKLHPKIKSERTQQGRLPSFVDSKRDHGFKSASEEFFWKAN